MANPQASIRVSAGSATGDGLPTVIGVPFPKGSLKDSKSVRLAGPTGAAVPVAARPLAIWPDGSVRWCLLAFGAKEKGSHTVSLSNDAAPAPTKPVRLSRDGDLVNLDNGIIQVSLSPTGRGPIHRLTANGHAYLAKPQDFRLMVDSADTTHEEQRTIRVLEESPVRVRVRIEGAHLNRAGKRKLNYRLDVELWAGSPTIRLDYHFFNLERGQDNLEIDRIAAEWDFALGKSTERHFHQNYYTLLYLPREVHNPAPVAIVVDETRAPAHVENPAMLLDTEQYNFHVRPPLVDTADWLGTGDGTRSVYVRMQDFGAMRPKRLASEGNQVMLEVWPRSASKLALPQGRTRRQVISLTFAESPTIPDASVAGLLDHPLWEGRACVEPAWLAVCGEFDMDRTFPPAANVRIEKGLRRLVGPQMVQSMFDLGDTVDSGYLRTYIPLGNAQELKPGAPKMPRVYSASGHSPIPDWAFPEFYEPVWTNNEYDLIHVLATELMRTGTTDHWTSLRWAVRHNIEVDFIHLSEHQQQHRATPQHSSNHNRSGAILSHFWTQGLMEYYCLTGDPDAMEVATALGDKIIEELTNPVSRQSFWGFTRELGWPTLALTHLANITGEPRFEKQLKEIIDFFVGYDRRKFHGPLNLSSGDSRYSLERQMISGFFAYACMIEGVDHYVRRTFDEKARQWLIQMIDELRLALDAHHREGLPTSLHAMHPVGMAIGYELTGDDRYLKSAMLCLEEHFESEAWTRPWPETKWIAMIYRGVIRFLYHAQKKGMLDAVEYPSAR